MYIVNNTWCNLAVQTLNLEQLHAFSLAPGTYKKYYAHAAHMFVCTVIQNALSFKKTFAIYFFCVKKN